MHRDLQDDECWAQGVMLRICTVIASLLLIYVYNMLFMHVDVVILAHTGEIPRSLTCAMSMP